MSTHTPGPWRLVQHPVNLHVVGGPNDTTVCLVRLSIVPQLNERPMADACLIAAAPDLLAALQAAVELMEQEDFGTITLVPKLRAAIAKATQP